MRFWTVQEEIRLFRAITHFKPVGLQKHFQMIAILNEINKDIPIDMRITPDEIYEKLELLYDLKGLDELEDEDQNGNEMGERSSKLGEKKTTLDPKCQFKLPFDNYGELMISRAQSDINSTAGASPRTDSEDQANDAYTKPEKEQLDSQKNANDTNDQNIERPRVLLTKEDCNLSDINMKPESAQTREESETLKTQTGAGKSLTQATSNEVVNIETNENEMTGSEADKETVTQEEAAEPVSGAEEDTGENGSGEDVNEGSLSDTHKKNEDEEEEESEEEEEEEEEEDGEEEKSAKQESTGELEEESTNLRRRTRRQSRAHETATKKRRISETSSVASSTQTNPSIGRRRTRGTDEGKSSDAKVESKAETVLEPPRTRGKTAAAASSSAVPPASTGSTNVSSATRTRSKSQPRRSTRHK
ncbi:hypothetical protein WICMUC_001009 [Wickerhamomyces mucosus]|uniref:Chromatin modification-related protein EAF7 n=1 Tax=Wickerhamomyces mucosus TaxID=1378264 RepID=A0A9P8PY22_9ASCO|nr:hypothetical protein WICMUC_001009 [Wickerhamomyces mucosus]